MSALTLYRFYSSTDELLYVGLTCNPGRRFNEHRSVKEWWAEVARIALEQHPDFATLQAAERQAIELERPRYNVQMNNAPAVTLDLDALAEGCGEWSDEKGSWCGRPPTHVGAPELGGGVFVCGEHAAYYTTALLIDRVALLSQRGWTRVSAHGSQTWQHPRYGGDCFTLAAAVLRENT